MFREISLYTNGLDEGQRVQLARALDHFHDAQQTLRLVEKGHKDLPLVAGCVDVGAAFQNFEGWSPSVVITGSPLSDNWFTHTESGCGLMTLADWEVAFLAEPQGLPVAAPDANILTSISLVTLMVLGQLGDWDVLHEKSIGCLFDLCIQKPERALKMRAAYVCSSCTAKLAMNGVSSVEIDAINAALDRVRHLVLGRRPQTTLPAVLDDEKFLNDARLPEGMRIPPQLLEACRTRSLSVLVGSGLSLQSDVRVKYEAPLQWSKLPFWSEVPSRMAESLNRYRGKTENPRITDSLDEFLADLDFFRESLGDALYYPRAILDIFTPHIVNAGLANRLLFRLPLRSLLTTNYDFVLQCAAPPGTPVYTWQEARPAREFLVGGVGRRSVVKIHGCASRSNTVVLTRVEYERLAQQQEYLSLVRSVFEHHTVLFVGFGLNDPRDLDHVLRQARLAGAAEGEKFALLPEQRCSEVRDKFPQIQVIPYSEHDQISKILATLVAAS
ncbi:SIR2 family NAD-dependent protein deacylase [Hydrogenophaga flava]|uniref:SIR2 family NAD-dependent protein deacylase n=1 Tax=Hydrogenophaga flava TaxID=65657 RepID=UPI0009FEBC44|nr:SIR2 family protein [Hydrogenophaga flava]